jgi:hypothetical protein
MSSAWAGFLVFTLSFIAFFFFNVLCSTCSVSDMAPFYASMIVVFCTFVSIFIFFLVDDFSAVLKAEIFAEFGELVTPSGAQLKRKFIAALIAIGVAPGVLLFLEILPSPIFANFRASPRSRRFRLICSSLPSLLAHLSILFKRT